MSARSIARWNNIPLSNPNDSSNNNLKRPHPDQEDDDDDDISLVSRSPSPSIQDAMDVDPQHISKYDEFYVRSMPPEVITVDTRIKNTNKGFAMLAKLGWAEGQPLGITGDGRVDPIPFQIKRDSTGLGKTTQDVRMIETTVSQRRGLDSERQQKETEDQRRAREDIVARRQALESEISTTLSAFYCNLCSKQFKNVAQYDEHTNSYAHHHKARMKDMTTNAKGLAGPSDADERKEKERKREEKELRRAAKAAGVRMVKPAATALVTAGTSTGDDAKPSGFKKSGWATVSSVPAPPPANAQPTASSKSGWASVGSPGAPTVPPRGEWAPAAPPSPPEPPATTRPATSAPAFRTAGWTSLDTGSSQPLPAAQEHPCPLPPPPPSNDFPPPPPLTAPPPPPPTDTNQGGRWGAVSSPQYPPPNVNSFQPLPPAPSPLAGHPHLVPEPAPAPARGGWQQWNSNGSKQK